MAYEIIPISLGRISSPTYPHITTRELYLTSDDSEFDFAGWGGNNHRFTVSLFAS